MPADLTELFFSFLKLLFVVAGVLYLVFSAVVIKQIYSMQKSLVTSFSKHLRIIGFVHFGLAILVLLFFVVSL
ncbi:hypothetical protein KJ707_02490 [Patescibacteria group bacterium]|nr:hypothetical protein [Patescibacteria group bacterium]MBU1967237.1 hypothetical protein [Patescibacteria group bacterium]MBU2543405.1 hypothetical protein [Patescibacteria group bacterium]